MLYYVTIAVLAMATIVWLLLTTRNLNSKKQSSMPYIIRAVAIFYVLASLLLEDELFYAYFGIGIVIYFLGHIYHKMKK